MKSSPKQNLGQAAAPCLRPLSRWGKVFRKVKIGIDVSLIYNSFSMWSPVLWRVPLVQLVNSIHVEFRYSSNLKKTTFSLPH